MQIVKKIKKISLSKSFFPFWRYQFLIKSLNKKINPLVKLPLPAATINMIFGKLGEEILLSNQRILPTKLKESGFTWLKTSPFGSIT